MLQCRPDDIRAGRHAFVAAINTLSAATVTGSLSVSWSMATASLLKTLAIPIYYTVPPEQSYTAIVDGLIKHDGELNRLDQKFLRVNLWRDLNDKKPELVQKELIDGNERTQDFFGLW